MLQVPRAWKGQPTNQICARDRVVNIHRCSWTISECESNTRTRHMLQVCNVNLGNQKQTFLVMISQNVVSSGFCKSSDYYCRGLTEDNASL